MEQGMQERRTNSVTINLIADRISNLHTDLKEVRNGLTETVQEFSKVVQQLVKLEEKSVHTADAIQRILKIAEASNERVDKVKSEVEEKIEKLEKRVLNMELEKSKLDLMQKWFFGGVTGLLTIVGIAVLKLIVVGG